MSSHTPWGEYRYRVVTTTTVTPVIRELWLAPSDQPLAYRAGQYVMLGDTTHRLPQRAYSIANAPRADGRISLLVTRFPAGPTSGWAHDVLGPGDAVILGGPYGTFGSSSAAPGPILLLAAGSGLAPIRALAEHLLAREPIPRVTLFFSVRTAADAIDRARFRHWEATHRGFHFLLALTRDPSALRHRHIPELIPETFDDLRDWNVFVAGPTGFVTGCAAAVRALGAAATAVHTEEFFADSEPWTKVPPALFQPGTSR